MEESEIEQVYQGNGVAQDPLNWLLIDGHEGDLWSLWSGPVVLAASSRHDNYNKYKKTTTCDLVMPIWSGDEVEEALKGTSWLDQLDEVSDYAGGIIRDYFATPASLKRRFEGALQGITFDDVRYWTGESPRGVRVDDIPQNVLLSAQPTRDGFYAARVVWRSPYIFKRFLQKLRREQLLRAELDFVMDPAPVGDKGDRLEKLVHLFLAVTEAPIYLETLKQHQARVKKMPRPLRMVTAQEKQRNLLKVRFDTTGQGRVARMFSGKKANDGQPENKGYDRVRQPGFWVPRDKNWPVIDSLYIDGDTVYLIQVTADRKHSASGFNQGLIDRLRASPAMASCSKWRIVWAIPQAGEISPTGWDEEAHKLFEDEGYVFELPADRAEKELQEYLVSESGQTE